MSLLGKAITEAQAEMNDHFIKNHVEYDLAVKKRDALEIEMENAYNLAYALQTQYNDIEEKIENYNQEQAALDE